jgi:hypothetical protein
MTIRQAGSHRIAAATMTLVRSSAEEELLRRSLQILADIGVPIAVADAGTSAAFGDFLQSLRGVVATRASQAGLVGQVQAAIEAAARFETPLILYTEPDKETFFARHLRDFMLQAHGEQAGLVLAARTPASFETFPPMQRYVESIVNHLCGDAVGVPGDYSYGPFLMHRTLVPLVMRADPQLGWGWRPHVFVAARREGHRLRHVHGPFECPDDQRVEDAAERTHRLRQLCQNVTGLIA